MQGCRDVSSGLAPGKLEEDQSSKRTAASSEKYLAYQAS
jgi:hypothetical protein